MPVAEYIKDSEHESSGRQIPKGTQMIVTRERMAELEEQEVAIQVGSESSKAIQDRTRAINDLAKRGRKSTRVKKKSAPKDKGKTKESKSTSKSDSGGKS